VALATTQFASSAVPGAINYQGRLTNAAGVPQPGTRTMSLKIYDAATSGTQLYAESMGSVVADANGVYSFQFGASGSSTTLVSETIATTDGTALTYSKALSNTPVVAGTASVTDGTYSWNELTGNPGSRATATATTVSGFVVGGTVTSGGSGYSSAPAVTITGNGSGATATATVSSGAVSAINITNAGSGYTNGATITIAAPPAPFVINYTGGTITATYATAPAAGKTITATYSYSASGITGALAAAEQWLELTVDGVVQTPRQKVLAVPFSMNSHTADFANMASSLAPVSGLKQNLISFKSYPVKRSIPYDANSGGEWNGRKVADYSTSIPLSKLTYARVYNITAAANNSQSSGSSITSYGTATISLVSYASTGTRTVLATQTISGTNGTLNLQGPYVLNANNVEYQVEITAGVYSTNTDYAISGVYSELTSASMTYDTK
jgi:hypothetical protein